MIGDDIWAEEEAMVERAKSADTRQALAQAPEQAMAGVGQLPLYPLSLAQAPNGNGNFFTKKMLGIPVWAWGLGLVGTAGAGYFWLRSREVKKNDGEGREEPTTEAAEPSGGYEPSRTEVGDQLRRYFTRKGMMDRVTIYTQAKDARKKLRQVSPLVTFKVSGTFKADKDLEKVCRREGLYAQDHGDGVFGLYPLSGGKKAKAWEEYIELLRNDGQEV